MTKKQISDIISTPVNLTDVERWYKLFMSDISDKIENEFPKYYGHFKEFQQSSEYKKYWDKCIESINDTELLSNIIFCNDIFCIPPVKTFLTYYKNDFIDITGDEKAILDPFVKKSIGAFWGMVFKFVLGYEDQKSVSVSMNEYFIIKTATYFIKGDKVK